MEDKIDEILNEVAKGARNDGFHARDLLAYPHQSDRYMKPARKAIKNLLLEARLSELLRLKKIDAFNEAYSTDPRCSKLIDVRLQELQEMLNA